MATTNSTRDKCRRPLKRDAETAEGNKRINDVRHEWLMKFQSMLSYFSGDQCDCRAKITLTDSWWKSVAWEAGLPTSFRRRASAAGWEFRLAPLFELSRSTLFGCGQCGAFDPHQLPQLHLGSANIRFGWHLLHRQCRGRQSLLDLHFGPSGAPQKSLSYEHNNILQIASFKLKHSQPEKLRDADHCELASACVETIRCAPWTTPSTWSSSNWLLADAKLLSLWVDVWATTTYVALYYVFTSQYWRCPFVTQQVEKVASFSVQIDYQLTRTSHFCSPITVMDNYNVCLNWISFYSTTPRIIDVHRLRNGRVLLFRQEHGHERVHEGAEPSHAGPLFRQIRVYAAVSTHWRKWWYWIVKSARNWLFCHSWLSPTLRTSTAITSGVASAGRWCRLATTASIPLSPCIIITLRVQRTTPVIQYSQITRCNLLNAFFLVLYSHRHLPAAH